MCRRLKLTTLCKNARLRQLRHKSHVFFIETPYIGNLTEFFFYRLEQLGNKMPKMA